MISRRAAGGTEAEQSVFEEIYDISALLGAGSIDYPGDRPYERRALRVAEKGIVHDLSLLDMTAHSGTHIDAPAHFVPGGKTIDGYDVRDFILPARVVNVADAEAVRPSALDGLNIRPGEAILFKTEKSASGLCTSGAFSESYVYITPEAAEVCVEKGVRLVGIDYISVDRFGDETYPAHRKLLESGTLILEGIDLRAVPEGRYTLFCAPLKIAGGEAAPARAFLAR